MSFRKMFSEGDSLLAEDHTLLLHAFIFVSWCSPPVIMREGWAPHKEDTLLQASLLHDLWKHTPGSQDKKKSFIKWLCKCFSCLSVISLHKLGPVAYQSPMSQECPFWEHCLKWFAGAAEVREWLFCLRKGEKEPLKPFSIYSWMIYACQSVKDPSEGQEIADALQLYPSGLLSQNRTT